jgi:hypothetical protein
VQTTTEAAAAAAAQTQTQTNATNSQFTIRKDRENNIWQELEEQANKDQISLGAKKEFILELAYIYEWYSDNGFYVHPKTTICSEICRTIKRKDINISKQWVWYTLDSRFKNVMDGSLPLQTQQQTQQQQQDLEQSSIQTGNTLPFHDKNLLFDNKILYEHKLEQTQQERTDLEYLTSSQLRELYYEKNTTNYQLAKIISERGVHITITPDLKNLILLLKEQQKKRKENNNNQTTTTGATNNQPNNNSQQQQSQQQQTQQTEFDEEEDINYDEILETAIRADTPYDVPKPTIIADLVEYHGKLKLIMADYIRKYPPSNEFIEKYGPLVACEIYMDTPGTDMKAKRSFARWIELGEVYDDHGKHGSSSLDKAVGMFKDKLTNEVIRVERAMTREHLGEKIPKIKRIRKLLYDYLPGKFALTKWYEGDPETKHELSMQRFAVGHSFKLSPKLSERSIGSH